MAETNTVGESATLLADLHARVRFEEAARRRAEKRAWAGAAVAVVHVLFIALLVYSEYVPILVTKAKEIEPLQWVSLPRRANVQPPEMIKPRAPDTGFINPDVILVLPKQQKPLDDNAITDFGWGLGRSLACGANSYEWLSPKMRAECRSQPWVFVYDRSGNVVLDARPRIQQQDERWRPSDVQARERNTAPPCPSNIDPNAPCLSAIIGGGR